MDPWSIQKKGLIQGVSWRKNGPGEYPGERVNPESIQEKAWIQWVSRRKFGSREYPGERMDPGSIQEKGWTHCVYWRKDEPVKYLGVYVCIRSYPGEGWDQESLYEYKTGSNKYIGERKDSWEYLRVSGWFQYVSRSKVGPRNYQGELLDLGGTWRKVGSNKYTRERLNLESFLYPS